MNSWEIKSLVRNKKEKIILHSFKIASKIMERIFNNNFGKMVFENCFLKLFPNNL